jgi:fucose 4-O-acetylase-like acetyltransferase
MKYIFGMWLGRISDKYNIPYIYLEWIVIILFGIVYILSRPEPFDPQFDIIFGLGIALFNIIIYFFMALIYRDMETFYELFRRPKK